MHNKFLTVVASICQFFFTVDVISIMILSVKEKKCLAATFTMLGLLLLAIIILVGLITIAIISA